MKKVFLTFLSLSLIGCASTPPPTANVNTANTANTATVVKNNDSPLVTSSHSTSQSSQQPPHGATTAPSNSIVPAPPKSSNGSDASSARSPMERPVDTAEMDAAIEKAEKEFKKNPADGPTKIALAEAYFIRATALTEAAQYRAALGDFRRGLKLDPTNAEAKDMQDQIVSIFKMLNREPPKEGQEPAPLPFKKA